MPRFNLTAAAVFALGVVDTLVSVTTDDGQPVDYLHQRDFKVYSDSTDNSGSSVFAEAVIVSFNIEVTDIGFNTRAFYRLRLSGNPNYPFQFRFRTMAISVKKEVIIQLPSGQDIPLVYGEGHIVTNIQDIEVI